MPFLQAIRTVFSEKKNILIFIAVSIIAVALYIWFQVRAVPGNDLAFQLAITPWWGFLLLALFAVATGLLITMNIFVFKNLRKVHVKEAGSTVVGSASGFIASVFSSPVCASCVSALFGFLGFGSVLLLLEYRWHILVASLGIMLVSLYFVSKRINGECANCKI